MSARTLTIIAAGNHHALLVARRATNASLAARRICAALPDLAPETAQVRAAIFEESLLDAPGDLRPGLRAPHHTVSPAGLLGSLQRRVKLDGSPDGRRLAAGEISLALGGALLLDEAPELRLGAIEGLAAALWDRACAFGYGDTAQTNPARTLMLAAAWPCPCGQRGNPERPCTCSDASVARYLGRLDRLSHLCGVVSFVDEVPVRDLDAAAIGRVRRLQRERFGRNGAGLVHGGAPVETAGDAAVLFRRDYWRLAARIDLAPRVGYPEPVDQPGGYHATHVLAVARTIADLDCYQHVEQAHVDEAVALCDLSLLRGEG